MIVLLDEGECELAALAGGQRRLRSIRYGLRSRYGHNGDAWKTDVTGVGAEMAVAKLISGYPSGLGQAGDVGRIEVRSTEHRRGALILHPADPDDRPFVLVIVLGFERVAREVMGRRLAVIQGRFDVVGWVMGGLGKRDEWWADPQGGRPAWFVPQSALNPIDPVAIAALSIAALPPVGATG